MATATASTPIPKDAPYTNGTNGISDAPHVMTWDEYLSEPTVYHRYDIVEGVRIFMSAPLVGHQVVSANVYDLLRAYQKQTATGCSLFAPCDVLVRRVETERRAEELPPPLAEMTTCAVRPTQRF